LASVELDLCKIISSEEEVLVLQESDNVLNQWFKSMGKRLDRLIYGEYEVKNAS